MTGVQTCALPIYPIGTGPWKFVEHIRGDRIVYEAVEHHWRATPQFKRLVFLKVPEPATRMAMLRAGSADVIETGGEYAEELQQVGVRTLIMPNVAWVWVILGGQWPSQPTYDPHVPCYASEDKSALGTLSVAIESTGQPGARDNTVCRGGNPQRGSAWPRSPRLMVRAQLL